MTSRNLIDVLNALNEFEERVHSDGYPGLAFYQAVIDFARETLRRHRPFEYRAADQADDEPDRLLCTADLSDTWPCPDYLNLEKMLVDAGVLNGEEIPDA